MTDRVVRALREVVGPAHVLDDPADTEPYARDWTGAYAGSAAAVVRPGTTEQVAGVLQVCRNAARPLVTQGGNTGLVGGGVPLHGEVVLSTGRLSGPVSVDADSGHATAWAGTPLQTLQAAAAAAGWAYGIDLASRGSATLGGTIATNAGGLRVLRYGDTRAQLLGVEAVLGSGECVRHLGGLARDNTGYFLPSLLAGSEGTLGVVTRAVVRLVPQPTGSAVALVGFASVAAAAAAAPRARQMSPQVSAVELMLAGGVRLVASVRGRRPPAGADCAAFLLVEVQACGGPRGGGSPRSAGAALQALTDVVEALPGVEDAAITDTSHGRAALWQWREGHTEAINTLGPPIKMDVTLPVPALAEFVATVAAATDRAAPGSRTWMFGHAGEGSVHVNVTGALDRAAAVQDAVFGHVAAMGGSISTEHGIGVAKRRWLCLVRTPEEIAAFRRLKAALDPDGVLNPHALLPER